ncbi:hypothetical protein PF002_g31919 [Phytophthora fragariae]|uniref:Secreted protein n=1 Tax=Phytophthora fragariae TaxID=53985 RepID=A0A6A3PDC9_9STRA|nr:hypothetical protein PF007_g31400 [Phytophthora fragariae]KAE9163213.1 hypothetical protein PF002_g31919 [Phytophthora fragariae]
MLPVPVVPVAALVAVTARALTAACGLGDFGGDCGDDEKPSGTTSGTAAPIPQGCLVKIADTRIAYGCFEKASILLLPLSPSALSRAAAIDNPRVTRDRVQWMVDLRVRHATQSTIRAQLILLCSLNTEWLLGL